MTMSMLSGRNNKQTKFGHTGPPFLLKKTKRPKMRPLKRIKQIAVKTVWQRATLRPDTVQRVVQKQIRQVTRIQKPLKKVKKKNAVADPFLPQRPCQRVT